MARVQEKPHWSVGKRLFDEAQAWDPWACEAGVWGTLSFIALASGPASTLPRLTPPLRPGPSHLSALLSSPLPPHVRCRKRDSILGVWSTEWPLQWGGDLKMGPCDRGDKNQGQGCLPGVMQHSSGDSPRRAVVQGKAKGGGSGSCRAEAAGGP